MAEDIVNITINGRRFEVLADRSLSFRDIADLAGFKSPAFPSMTCRVQGREGRIIVPGVSVVPVEGMILNVADTSNA